MAKRSGSSSGPQARDSILRAAERANGWWLHEEASGPLWITRHKGQWLDGEEPLREAGLRTSCVPCSRADAGLPQLLEDLHGGRGGGRAVQPTQGGTQTQGRRLLGRQGGLLEGGSREKQRDVP